jgi:uncharacterized repeat protein (TIGR01451 family)
MKKLLLIVFSFLAAVNSCFAMSVSLSFLDDACSENSGRIRIDAVFGGVPPYTFLWSTSAVTDSIYGLPAGTYTVTVTDANNNTATASTTLINNAQLNLAYNYSYVTCNGPGMHPCPNICNGAIAYCYPIGGTPPYSITSSIGNYGLTGDGNPYVSGLCNGDYPYITITDALGCFGSDNVTIDGPSYPNPVISPTGSCNSMNNGSVTITLNPPDGSWMEYGYITDTLYNNVSNQFMMYQGPNTVNNLAPGNYFLNYQFMQVTSPCLIYFPFTVPDLGNTCSTVEGDVFVDLNADCIEDVGEIGVPNTIIEFTPGSYYTYTDWTGHYSTNLVWGNYNMTHYPPASLTPLCPASPFPISLSSVNTSDTVNFADTSNIAFDVAAHIAHGTARPGFDFSYGVSAQNLSYASSGMLTVTLDYDPLLSFVSANPAPFSTSSGQVIWQLSAITNFQSANASVLLHVPSNATIGNPLTASVTVQATTPETNLSNNTASTSHIITGAFDPNVKTVENPAASFIPATQGLFNYTIQFQNTGNDTAFNVEVIDTLNSNLDVTTFIPEASSHAYTTELTGHGVIHFHFNNILLPDSTTDEPHSHGFVSFQIRSKQNLAQGTNINNTSNIVFDFNPPVNTNTTTNTVDLTLAINASATTICSGQSVTLTMIPELQNTPWRWRAGNCSASIIGSGNSINVSPSVTTTYFVRDSAGTMPVGSCYRKIIIVNPAPTASITPSGPTTFCQGNSVTLTSTAASSYLWSDNSSTQNINVTSSGSYAVTITNANGCTASTSLSVTVNPLPNASITPSGPTTFCAGNSVTLTSSTANNYLWSNSSSSQSINVTASGNYVVTVTDANNCSSASPATTVTINPNPLVPAITQSGDSLISDASNSYQWYFNSVLIAGATSQSYHPTQNGNYSVVITDANNCSSSSSDYPFVLTEAENLNSADGIVIYPNPARGELVVGSLPANTYGSPQWQAGSGFGDKDEIIIYSLIGEKLLNQKPKANSQRLVINVSALRSGVYFLEVKTQTGITRRKFMKI